MTVLFRFAGTRLVNAFKSYIYTLLIPKGLTLAKIDRGQLYIFNPSDSTQAFFCAQQENIAPEPS
ncbi:MAG: hypothetical protein ABWW65_03560 [Thermoprotei archaeon]